MSTSAAEDLARVTVISPTRRIDLALPGSVTLGELLPSIVRFSGYEGGGPQEAVHAWVLQRFGDDPLDPNALISKLSIRDGETLYLRQRDNAMPDAAFDDVVDAVSLATAHRPRWQPRHSQNMAIALLGTVLVALPVLLGVIAQVRVPVGQRGIAWALVNVGLAFLAAIASIVLSRAFGRYKVAAALAWSSVALAGLGGWQLLDTPQWSPRVVVASALVLIAAASCALAARVTTMGLFTMSLMATFILIAATAQALSGASMVHICALGASVLLAATGYMPTLSYRLARIALPNLPNTAEGLLADDQPVQSDIVARAVAADQLLASMLAALSYTIAALAVPLIVLTPPHLPGARSPWWQLALALCIGLALLLRARSFVGLSQRLSLLLAGSLITGGAVLAGVLQFAPGAAQLAVLVAVIAIASSVLVHYASLTYARVITPIWGRLGDILEWLSNIAIVPVLLGVLNLYAAMRGLLG